MSDVDLECQQIVEMVNDYLDGVLSSEEKARFDAHVERCVSCTRYREQMWLVVQSVHRVPPPEPDDRSQARLLRLFREWARS